MRRLRFSLSLSPFVPLTCLSRRVPRRISVWVNRGCACAARHRCARICTPGLFTPEERLGDDGQWMCSFSVTHFGAELVKSVKFKCQGIFQK